MRLTESLRDRSRLGLRFFSPMDTLAESRESFARSRSPSLGGFYHPFFSRSTGLRELAQRCSVHHDHEEDIDTALSNSRVACSTSPALSTAVTTATPKAPARRISSARAAVTPPIPMIGTRTTRHASSSVRTPSGAP